MLIEICCHVIIHKWVSAMQGLDFHIIFYATKPGTNISD